MCLGPKWHYFLKRKKIGLCVLFAYFYDMHNQTSWQSLPLIFDCSLDFFIEFPYQICTSFNKKWKQFKLYANILLQSNKNNLKYCLRFCYFSWLHRIIFYLIFEWIRKENVLLFFVRLQNMDDKRHTKPFTP